MTLEIVVKGKTIIATGRPAEVARTLREIFMGLTESKGEDA